MRCVKVNVHEHAMRSSVESDTGFPPHEHLGHLSKECVYTSPTLILVFRVKECASGDSRISVGGIRMANERWPERGESLSGTLHERNTIDA